MNAMRKACGDPLRFKMHIGSNSCKPCRDFFWRSNNNLNAKKQLKQFRKECLKKSCKLLSFFCFTYFTNCLYLGISSIDIINITKCQYCRYIKCINIEIYPYNLSNKSGIPPIVVSNLTNSKYTRFMKTINTGMYLFNLSEKIRYLKNLCFVSDDVVIKSNAQLCNVSDISCIKSNNLSILADNSIQDPIINLIGKIQPCILLDVMCIINSSAYDSIQDPKFDSKSV